MVWWSSVDMWTYGLKNVPKLSLWLVNITACMLRLQVGNECITLENHLWPDSRIPAKRSTWLQSKIIQLFSKLLTFTFQKIAMFIVTYGTIFLVWNLLLSPSLGHWECCIRVLTWISCSSPHLTKETLDLPSISTYPVPHEHNRCHHILYLILTNFFCKEFKVCKL